MRISNEHDLTPYNQIYLSPHLDDAVLSCGGAITQARQRGERVLVVTVCTAAPPPEGPFNSLAQEFHAHWQLQPEHVVATRLQEDAAAMDRLGADFLWANFLDAIYRAPEAYTSRESLFGTPFSSDPLLPALTDFVGELRRRAPHASFSTPLGVGFHVDHQITHKATVAACGSDIQFYEDVPYATHAGALEARLNRADHTFAPHLIPIRDALDTKISAISAYASQLAELFRTEPMPQVIRKYHAAISNSTGPCERVWLIQQ